MSYARVTIAEVDPARMDEAIDVFRDQVLQTARSLPGYKGASLLLDRAGGTAIGMSYWETEQARSDADERMNAVRAESLRAMGVDPDRLPPAQMYEIAVDDYDV